MSKIALIITAWKEAITTAEIVRTAIQNSKHELSIVLVAPDNDTTQNAQNTAHDLKFQNLISLKDKQNGKPAALNMAFEYVSQNLKNVEFVVCTDGDIVVGDNSVNLLVDFLLDKSQYYAVTGRPQSLDPKDNFWGYVGNMLADAAHAKRTQDFASDNFIFMSGYLLGFKKELLDELNHTLIPKDCLIDDAYLSIFFENIQPKNQNSIIGYSPLSTVGIKYPNNYKDWMLQKTRSVGGYRQLKNFFPNQPKNLTKSRIWDELRWIAFPLQYAKNETELFYSMFFYLLRMDLWIRIIILNILPTKKSSEIWKRVESTK
jgi:cellulose synthase/poly-beta-1,6-N-acetylglucosamine synthase-like glycosyltransferase